MKQFIKLLIVTTMLSACAKSSSVQSSAAPQPTLVSVVQFAGTTQLPYGTYSIGYIKDTYSDGSVVITCSTDNFNTQGTFQYRTLQLADTYEYRCVIDFGYGNPATQGYIPSFEMVFTETSGQLLVQSLTYSQEVNGFSYPTYTRGSSQIQCN